LEEFKRLCDQAIVVLNKTDEKTDRLVSEYGFWTYPDMTSFVRIISGNARGFVMVHDWQSFMPDNIKEYVKKTMKRELRVESMDVSPDDKWPLELYSWGFDAKKTE